MDSARIRPIEREDIPGCMRVAALAWTSNLGSRAKHDFEEAFVASSYRPVFYVAEIAGLIVGTINWVPSWMDDGVYEICWVAVDPDYQGQGIARALIQRCLNDLSPFAKAITLITHTAEHLYTRFGFVTVYEIARPDGNGTNKWMVLSQ